MKRLNKKSQTFLEYAVLIALAAAALIAMGAYMAKAVQGKYRQSADVFGEGEQYKKGVTVVGEE
jgi:Flp pilus assembly pilin Flp